MKITILGSGTSHGVPVIGCSCRVCTSRNPKNRRLRTSAWIETDGSSILIDTSTDFRTQALRAGITTLDVVVLSHSHADHIHGLDDLRPLTFEKTLPVYGSSETIEEVKSRFDYIFKKTQQGGGKPNIVLKKVETPAIKCGNADILLIPAKHGELNVLGFRVDDFAYVTDVSAVPDASMELLRGAEVIVIDGLRYRPHPTHFSVDEAVAVLKELQPDRGYITHICHDIDHDEVSAYLPAWIKPAWDGLVITL